MTDLPPSAADPAAPAARRWRCSLASLERGDQRVGTAVPAPRWMLVGHRGPWTDKAATTPPIPDVRGELVRRLDLVGARLQLVRRHGRALDQGADQPVILVDSVRGRVLRTTWRDPGDLVTIAEAFQDGLPDVCADPIVLVCTHGKKDVCCAIEGRLVARVLDDVLPGSVWETTHLGGDRFAGNVAILPDGSMYGGVDGSTAPDVVIGHLDGHVDLDRWRGRTVWTAPEQVAVLDLLREGVSLADVVGVRSSQLEQHRFEVEVQTVSGPRWRLVARGFTEPHRLTCSGGPAVAARWTVL